MPAFDVVEPAHPQPDAAVRRGHEAGLPQRFIAGDDHPWLRRGPQHLRQRLDPRHAGRPLQIEEHARLVVAARQDFGRRLRHGVDAPGHQPAQPVRLQRRQHAEAQHEVEQPRRADRGDPRRPQSRSPHEPPHHGEAGQERHTRRHGGRAPRLGAPGDTRRHQRHAQQQRHGGPHGQHESLESRGFPVQSVGPHAPQQNRQRHIARQHIVRQLAVD